MMRIRPGELLIVAAGIASGWSILGDRGRLVLVSPRRAWVSFGVPLPASPGERPYEITLDEIERTGW